jgi:hypothetical protein
MATKSFKDLIVWQKARDLAVQKLSPISPQREKSIFIYSIWVWFRIRKPN